MCYFITMRIHCFTHDPLEPPGLIADWAKDKGFSFVHTFVPEAKSLPQPDEIDCLIVLGGPQSLNDMEAYPYFKPALSLTEACLAAEKRMLGICLGAQLISTALGAPPEKSPFKEAGVFPISLSSDGRKDPLFKSADIAFPVMHWHEDMFGVPNGAKILAFSDGCPRQAIRYNDYAYGFQFHLEFTTTLLKPLLKKHAKFLTKSPYVQTASALQKENFDTMNQHMLSILDQLIALGT